MINIVIQVVLFQVLFLIAYELLFRKETFFNWNRAYLLITSLASIVLPFIKLELFSKVVPTDFFVNLPAVIIGEESKIVPVATQSLPSSMVTTSSFSIDYTIVWFFGVFVFAIILCNKLYRLWKYKHNNSIENREEYSLITITNSTDAFSFLRTIFLGDSIEQIHKESIINHEKVHVKEKHTLDLLWFEALRIVMWFNPLVYLYQKRITEVHEFIADKSASKHQKNYYENLLAKTFNIGHFSIVNQFYSSSLIKKRIIMLTKEQSQKRKLVKYLTVIPIVLAMLVYVSCNDTLETEINNEANSLTEEEVIKNVFSIVNNTLPPDVKEEAITESQLKEITTNLKSYIKKNEEEIASISFDKYLSQLYPIDNLDLLSERNDILILFAAEMFTLNLINKLKDPNIEKSDIRENLPFLLNSEGHNKLKELNFELSNYEELKALSEDVSVKEEIEVEKIYKNEVPFSEIDQAPIFPGSLENATETSSKKIFSQSISKHINDNFNRNIAKEHNLKGRQKLFIGFKLDKKGKVKDIQARVPHNAVKEEAIRVMETLPKMKPAIHNNEKVAMAFSIPIIFNVED